MARLKPQGRSCALLQGKGRASAGLCVWQMLSSLIQCSIISGASSLGNRFDAQINEQGEVNEVGEDNTTAE